MADTNVAIKLYKTNATSKRVGINVTNSIDTTGYALYVNGATNITGSLTLGTALPIASGGTGKTTAAAAWTALGGGASGKHPDNYFALASHTHNVSQLVWGNNDNLTLTAPSKNNAEYSIDMPNTSYTGSYWHVWSGKNSSSIIRCLNDDSSVSIPSGILYLGDYNVANTYAKEYTQTIDLTNYSTSYWYPVCITIPATGMRRIACRVQLNSGSTPWSGHSGGSFTAVVEMLVTAGGWGTTAASSICLQNDQRWLAEGAPNPVGYSQFINSSSACFWCRGGAKYFLASDWFGSWKIYSTNTVVSSQTIAPTTSYPGLSFTYSQITGSFYTWSGDSGFRCRNISYGTSIPSNSIGNNGDVFIKY